jgi:hypothetical protein
MQVDACKSFVQGMCHQNCAWSAPTASDMSDCIALPCIADTGGAATSRSADVSDGEDAAFFDADRQLDGDMTAQFPAHA